MKEVEEVEVEVEEQTVLEVEGDKVSWTLSGWLVKGFNRGLLEGISMLSLLIVRQSSTRMSLEPLLDSSLVNLTLTGLLYICTC